MKLIANPTHEELTSAAVEAAGLLASGQLDALASAYGYALAFDRGISAAVRQDLEACLKELGATSLSPPLSPPVVQRFDPNSSGLLAQVSCQLPAGAGHVLLELVVTAKGANSHVSLEQLTAVA